MANSIQPAGSQPAGFFRHEASKSEFRIFERGGQSWQSEDAPEFSTAARMAYRVGSGSHAFGFLLERGGHLFQSPLSYYVTRKAWDMAPGYENSPEPDFSRPVTVECLSCHADRPRPIPDTLNSYLSPPIEGAGIQCDRCHGSPEKHLKNPVPGSILNPAKLPQAARDSICEQCHLTGEIRIPNAGEQIPDFRPGQALEEVYTVYVSSRDSRPGESVKVVSQAEQLALSRCARNSGGNLWCGTCHDVHEPLQQTSAYYRDKCLACHAKTLAPSHAAPAQDCVGCHMPRLPAKDGGHTAFTDHWIRRNPGTAASDQPGVAPFSAWRQPDPSTAERNLALALVTAGIQEHDSASVIRGYRTLNRLEKDYLNDPALLTALGTVLLTAKQPGEARLRFERALALRTDYAPYEVNLADALMESGDIAAGTRHLEKAVQMDPLLEQAVQLLRQAYISQGERAKAEALMNRYREAMGIKDKEKK